MALIALKSNHLVSLGLKGLKTQVGAADMSAGYVTHWAHAHCSDSHTESPYYIIDTSGIVDSVEF